MIILSVGERAYNECSYGGYSIRKQRSRFGCEYQWRVICDDRTVLKVPFVRIHVIGAPLEPAAGECAQISGQPPFACHEVQSHFEFLLKLLL